MGRLRAPVIGLILRLATGARAALAAAVFALGGTALFRLSPYEDLKSLLGGASLPEETISSPDALAQTLAALDAAGRELYLKFQLWDVLNPVLMGLAGALLLGWLVKRSGRAGTAWRLVLVLPVVLLAADVLENVIIAAAIGAFPERAVIAHALPIVTASKFGAAMATAVTAVLLALVWLRDRLSSGPRNTT